MRLSRLARTNGHYPARQERRLATTATRHDKCTLFGRIDQPAVEFLELLVATTEWLSQVKLEKPFNAGQRIIRQTGQSEQAICERREWTPEAGFYDALRKVNRRNEIRRSLARISPHFGHEAD
jgi:hypothetical protein